MIYQPLYKLLSENNIWQDWLEILPKQVDQKMDQTKNGNLAKWLDALDNLPNINSSYQNLNDNYIMVGHKSDCNKETTNLIRQQLKNMMPWRKGPYQLFDITIDTEWRSDWKWERLCEHITPLSGRTVLDVGCGNGYHSWRMAGCDAKLVIGIDPSLLFVMQYQVIQKYLKHPSVFVLPLRLEDMPSELAAFDTVFSMGVLYHRRSPIDHLIELRDKLKPGGELVLETLVVEGNENTVFVPNGRYAKMNNVWFLPSPDSMLNWIKKTGFTDIKLVNVNQTSIKEQHCTEWMQYESLENFLDPGNPSKTIEGHPAPIRAIFIAKKPKQ